MADSNEHVIVFDDISQVIKSQKNAAWTEVARRLAHEIKNPLTPIQLSAERLRHKYMPILDTDNQQGLERMTHTIIQQVDAMKEMVNAFSSYARTPEMKPELVDINRLLNEVLELYRDNTPNTRIECQFDESLPEIKADPGKLRQVFHNLLKNTFETERDSDELVIQIVTTYMDKTTFKTLEIQIRDNGLGFDDAVLENVFEPYVTTKQKGTGLGLAIVSKIIEEHGGQISAANPEQGGACVTISLPVAFGNDSN